MYVSVYVCIVFFKKRISVFVKDFLFPQRVTALSKVPRSRKGKKRRELVLAELTENCINDAVGASEL
jgi:hypothetical protein